MSEKSKSIVKLLIIFILICGAKTFYPAALAHAAGISPAAVTVYGQASSFTSNLSNSGGVSVNSLNYLGRTTLDSNGNLYVADKGNNRVLYYPAGSQTATRIYGQGGNFTTTNSNNGGTSANSLYQPYGVALDSSGNLYVADQNNNRVLYYPVGSTTATRVYGQNGSFTSSSSNNGNASANTLNLPTSVTLDSGGNLYVADQNNNRVLYYPAGSTIATRVYGQNGSFISNSSNNGGISANSLYQPYDVTLDNSGNLYVADNANNRVLYYPAGSTTATRVYGQGGNFTIGNSNNGGVSANSLYQPTGIALDSNGNLYVADNANNRVLYYPVGSTTATRVIGQSGFTTNIANNSGISASSLFTPAGLALDSSGDLYVADQSNNRVLYYPAGSTTATRVYGQGGNFTSNSFNNGGTSANSLATPSGLALDSSGNLYISDSNNNRVLYYSSGSTTATRAYGQGGSFTTSNGGVSATALNHPIGVVLDSSGDLWTTDYYNSRVLYYPTGSLIATRVYGQGGSFTTSNSNNYGISATSLDQPFALALDSSGNLYVSDYYNNRVLKFQTNLSISTQPPASIAAGSTFSTSVALVDVGSGAVFSDFTGTISVTIKGGRGTTGAVLSGTTSNSTVNGVATFSNLSINLGGTGYILTLSSLGVGSVDTNSFTITGGATGKLLFTPLTSPYFAFTLTGSSGTVTSQHTFKVSDTTQSGLGWHLNITSTQFTAAGGKTLPTTANTITAVSTACTAGQRCVLPVNGTTGYPMTVPAATVAPPPITYYSANKGTGTGDVTITTIFSLSIAPGTASGTYTSTVSETLVNSSTPVYALNSGGASVGTFAADGFVGSDTGLEISSSIHLEHNE